MTENPLVYFEGMVSSLHRGFDQSDTNRSGERKIKDKKKKKLVRFLIDSFN